jgi:hypothetical protein
MIWTVIQFLVLTGCIGLIVIFEIVAARERKRVKEELRTHIDMMKATWGWDDEES